MYCNSGDATLLADKQDSRTPPSRNRSAPQSAEVGRGRKRTQRADGAGPDRSPRGQTTDATHTVAATMSVTINQPELSPVDPYSLHIREDDMTATVHLIEDEESYAEYAEVRVAGYHFPIATYDTIEEAEDLVADPDKLAAFTRYARESVLENYDAETIAKYNMIPA